MNHRILRLPAVIERTGLARSTIYLRMRNGNFPAPVNLGGRAIGWVEADVETWLGQQIANSRSETPSNSVGAKGDSL